MKMRNFLKDHADRHGKVEHVNRVWQVRDGLMDSANAARLARFTHRCMANYRAHGAV